MPKKVVSQTHRENLSKALLGNRNGKGKNIGNKNALGKVSGKNNGNWKGGTSQKHKSKKQEEIAGRKRSEKCDVCYKIGKVDFDHCHKEKHFRGWLCRRCNLVLGMVKDDKILLLNLVKYLECSYERTRPKSIINSLLYAVFSDNSDKESN